MYDLHFTGNTHTFHVVNLNGCEVFKSNHQILFSLGVTCVYTNVAIKVSKYSIYFDLLSAMYRNSVKLPGIVKWHNRCFTAT